MKGKESMIRKQLSKKKRVQYVVASLIAAFFATFSVVLCFGTCVGEAQAAGTISIKVDDYGRFSKTNNDTVTTLKQNSDYRIGSAINIEPKEMLINGRSILKEMSADKQKQGYTLVWYDQSNKPFYWVRTPSNTAPDLRYEATVVTNSLTALHGKWEKKLCTVTLSDGYGSAKGVAQFVQNGSSIREAMTKGFKLRQPSRPGYTFLGWHDQSDGNDSSIYNIDAKVNGALKLVALWKLSDEKKAELDDPGELEEVPDTVSGTCWIGSNWDYKKSAPSPGDPYDGWPGTAFTLTDFSGYLQGSSGIGYCISPTAAAPCNTTATYNATLRDVDYDNGIVTYDVTIYPPDTTDGTTRDSRGLLTGYQIVSFVAEIHKNFGGWIDIQKFSENENITDGNPMYSLDGAEYGIFTDEACTTRAETSEGVVPELVTDTNGYAKSALLPIGTYYVKELKAPKGYALSEDVHSVAVSSNKTTRDEEYDKPQGDMSLKIQKVDGDSGKPIAAGDGELAGAVFAVRYYSTDNVADKESAAVKRTWYIVTDDNGVANLSSIVPGKRSFSHQINKHPYTLELSSDEIENESGSPMIPLGLVEIQEIIPPKGYKLDNGLTIENTNQLGKILGRTYTFNVTGDQLSSAIDMKRIDKLVNDDIHRSDFYIKKTAANSSRALVHVPFVIELIKDGKVLERHLAVTDDNGIIKTTNDWNEHSNQTNENDQYLTGTDSSTYKITDESKLDSNCGIYFSGYSPSSEESKIVMQDKDRMEYRGAFPYGMYRIIELRCEANKGYSLVDIAYNVTRNNAVGPSDTVQDQPISIHTTATDNTTGDHIGFANKLSKTTVLNDVVEYSGLIANKKYSLTGTLMDKSTGKELFDENGNKITSTIEFEADENGSGSVVIPFTVSTSLLEGKTTVVFESLIENGSEAASHADIKDEGQTVYYPALHTTATDSATGDHEGSSVNDTVTINDTVKYTNLKPGKEYKVTGTLMDKSTGEPLVSEDGKEITETKTFTPDEADGEVVISFDVKTSLVAGKTVVVYENAFYQDVLVAAHADINDEGQTVYYPAIHTTATDGVTGDHEGLADGNVILNDEVSYENLEIGQKYTISGVLTDKKTGESLKDKSGKEITSSTTFTAGDVLENVKLIKKDESIPTIRYCINGEWKTFGENEKVVVNKNGSYSYTNTDKDSGNGLQTTFSIDDNGKATVTSVDRQKVDAGEISGDNTISCNYYDIKYDNGSRYCHFNISSPIKYKNGDKVDTLYTNADVIVLGDKIIAMHKVSDTEQVKSIITLKDNKTVLISSDNMTRTETDGKFSDWKTTSTENKEIALDNIIMPYVPTSVDNLNDVTINDNGRVSGKAIVSFTFEGSAVLGRQLVVFEDLYRGVGDFSVKANVARHADLSDEGQEVDYPELHTTATVNGEHTATATESIELTDVITYTNLEPGKTYRAEGRLVSKTTGEAVTDGSTGVPVASSVEFVPESENGTVSVRFSFDGSKLGGSDTVVFENLYKVGAGLSGEDAHVGKHEDLGDTDQTIHFNEADLAEDIVATGDVAPYAIAGGALIALIAAGVLANRRKH